MSTTSFRHFLMTRYAIADRSGIVPQPDDVWFAGRLELFKRYALAAVKAQTVRNFRWFLFYSPEYLRHMEALLADADCPIDAIPIVRGDWQDFNEEMREEMKRLLHNETHVISTRLDSDDTIAPDFMEIIQAQFAGQKRRTFLNFEHGILLEDGRAVQWSNAANMFQSVIEPVSDLKGIYTWHHGYTHEAGEVVQLQHPGRWTHVRHEYNSARMH